MTSYYDTIGLLAICDAIDSIEGVPLSALESAKPPSAASSPPKSTPPNSTSKTPNEQSNQSPRTLPSDDSVEILGSSDDAQTEKKHSYLPYRYPPQSSTALDDGSESNSAKSVRIPYNYEGSAALDTSATTNRTYPMFYAQPLTHSFHTHNAYALGTGVGGHDDKGGSDPLLAAAAAAMSSSPYPGSQLLARHHSVSKGNDLYSLQRKKDLRNARKLSSGVLGQDRPALKMSDKSYYNKQTPTPLSPNVSGGGGGHHDNNGRPALVINGYKVEECPICGRNFKGPKASTHKQQHIRRLHPEDYTPKRGGKKRLAPDSPI